MIVNVAQAAQDAGVSFVLELSQRFADPRLHERLLPCGIRVSQGTRPAGSLAII